MIGDALFFIHYALLLLYGVTLSAAFAGVHPTRKNVAVLGATAAVSGVLQLAVYLACDENAVRLAYPFLAHLPVVAVLHLHFRKRLLASITSVSTAYLCCQPARWVGALAEATIGNPAIVTSARILTLLVIGYVILRYVAEGLSSIYNRDVRSALIFSIVPLVYYLFDYCMAVYSDLWARSSAVATEFIPAFLCIAFLAFSVTYYRMFEQKTEYEHREQVISIALEQQARELETIREGDQRVRILRHDMKLQLENIASCLDEGDIDAVRKMLSGYTAEVESTAVHRFCENNIINYTLSHYLARCKSEETRCEIDVKIGDLPVDEIAFASILSNALDNALNAQSMLAPEEREIKVSLKMRDGRLLLSVRNTYGKAPTFVDGMPVTKRPGHGYGTQSIRYIAEHLGGSCQFTVEDGQFVLRVVIEA